MKQHTTSTEYETSQSAQHGACQQHDKKGHRSTSNSPLSFNRIGQSEFRAKRPLTRRNRIPAQIGAFTKACADQAWLSQKMATAPRMMR
jgi:hypothetical protein